MLRTLTRTLLPVPVLLGYLLVASGALLAGCGDGSGGTTAEASQDSLKLNVDEQMLKQVSDVVVTVPSPLEMTSLMKKSNTRFSAAMLSNAGDVRKYSTVQKQALNLGVYGADLGYVAYFNQSDAAAKYLRSATTLANNLQVMGAFETTLLERVDRNLNQQDSLLYIITEQYEAAENHLKSVNRPHVSALIVAGGWIEGLYLATQLQKEQPNDLIRTRIGEVKLSLSSLLQLLNAHKAEEGVEPIFNQLLDLSKSYEKVNITYGTEAPASKVENGVKVVSTGSNSSVEISPETVSEITQKIEAIRKSITA